LPRKNASNAKKSICVYALFVSFCGYHLWLRLCRAVPSAPLRGKSPPAPAVRRSLSVVPWSVVQWSHGRWSRRLRHWPNCSGLTSRDKFRDFLRAFAILSYSIGNQHVRTQTSPFS
jgi:hypothetical protein